MTHFLVLRRCRDRSAAHDKDVSIPTRDRQYSYWLAPLAALGLSTAPRLGLYLDFYWAWTWPRLDLSMHGDGAEHEETEHERMLSPLVVA